jgi:TonB family protein
VYISRDPNLVPDIQFMPRGKGLRIETILTLANGKVSMSCDDLDVGVRLAKGEKEPICARLKSKLPRQIPRGRLKSGDYANRVTFWLKQNEFPSKKLRSSWVETVGYSHRNGVYRYRTNAPISEEGSIPGSGKFAASMTDDDYPAEANEFSMSGFSTVVLSVNETGAVQSCRPIESSGFLILDKRACDVLRRTGKFTFDPQSPLSKGLLYVRQTIRWTVSD